MRGLNYVICEQLNQLIIYHCIFFMSSGIMNASITHSFGKNKRSQVSFVCFMMKKI